MPGKDRALIHWSEDGEEVRKRRWRKIRCGEKEVEDFENVQ